MPSCMHRHVRRDAPVSLRRVRPPEIRLAALIATLAFFDLAMWLTAIPLIPVWESELGLTHTQSGIVLGAYGVAVLFLSLPAGHLADRLGRAPADDRRDAAVRGHRAAVRASPLVRASCSRCGLVNGLFSAVSWTAGLAWLVASVPGHATAAARSRS